jgi:hypothetical protein
MNSQKTAVNEQQLIVNKQPHPRTAFVLLTISRDWSTQAPIV